MINVIGSIIRLSQMTKFQTAVKWLSLACFIILAVALIVEASMPGNLSSSHSGAVSNAVVDATEKIEGVVGGTNSNEGGADTPTLSEQIKANWSKFNYYLRKGIGHFGAFFVLAIFGTIAFMKLGESKENGFLVSLVLGVSIALATEIIQLYRPGRAGTATDVGIDSLGYLCGMAICLVVVIISSLVKRARGKRAV